MKRIDTPNRALDLFGAGKDGFRNGNLALNLLPTEFNADWPNGIQEELLAIVETAGLVPSGADLAQVRKAIDIMLRKRSGLIAAAAGSANALTGAFTPAVAALTNGLGVLVRAAAANSVATPTFQADATVAKTIVRPNGQPLLVGDISGAGHWLDLLYDQAQDAWVLRNPAQPDVTGSGMVAAFARNTAPAGWLKANGAAVSRTTYAALFAAIGTTFGVGDGATTFNLPDLRGEFIRGWDDGRGIDSGRAFGSLQRGSLLSYDSAAGATPDGVFGVSITGNPTFAALQAAAGVDAYVTGDYPNTYLGASNVATSFPTPGSGAGVGAAGVARPRNVSLLYCIKY